jgi:hypothetical protein
VTLSPDPNVLNTSVSTHGDASFVNELNQTIFMHELAMGCSILCQLRRGDSNMWISKTDYAHVSVENWECSPLWFPLVLLQWFEMCIKFRLVTVTFLG